MLWADLVQAVTNLTKVGVAATSETRDVIATGLKNSWRELIETRPLTEWLRNRVPLVLTTAVADKGVLKIAAINTVVDILEVRFASGADEWTLADETTRVPPAAVQGKPRAYRLMGQDLGTPANGDRIYIEPWAAINSATDQCYVSYWEMPPMLGDTAAAGTSTADPIIANTYLATTKWDTELIDRAAAYTFIYYKKIDQAQALLSKYKAAPQTQQQQNPQS